MSRETTLTTDTRITIALLALLASPFFVGIILYYKVDAMQKDIKQMWSVPQQVIWAERLANQNPSLRIPAVAEVVKIVSKDLSQLNQTKQIP